MKRRNKKQRKSKDGVVILVLLSLCLIVFTLDKVHDWNKREKYKDKDTTIIYETNEDDYYENLNEDSSFTTLSPEKLDEINDVGDGVATTIIPEITNEPIVEVTLEPSTPTEEPSDSIVSEPDDGDVIPVHLDDSTFAGLVWDIIRGASVDDFMNFIDETWLASTDYSTSPFYDMSSYINLSGDLKNRTVTIIAEDETIYHLKVTFNDLGKICGIEEEVEPVWE